MIKTKKGEFRFEDLLGQVDDIFKEDGENLPASQPDEEMWDTGREQAFWKNIPEQGSLWKN